MSFEPPKQAADKFVMIRPLHFGYNAETAGSNSFQHTEFEADVSAKACEQFDNMLQLLLSAKIDVVVFEDNPRAVSPDSVFPNNWFACPGNKSLFLFPMLSPLRRLERRPELISRIKEQFNIESVLDYSDFENRQQFLEGTGSMVFDHIHKIAYASVSPRTDEDLFYTFCKQARYEPMLFHAFDDKALPVYHTNVLLTVGESFAVFCAEAIPDNQERSKLIDSLVSTGHELIYINRHQMNCFAGNMLQMKNKENASYLICSQTAFRSLYEEQINRLRQYGELITPDISVIEQVGGGSVRCMIAEIF